ncbi:MAG: hypothetical protein AAB488_00245 [Patescibacteria group bacterium]
MWAKINLHPTEILGELWNWGEVLFLIQVLYTVASLKTVGPTELGAILFFGKPTIEVHSGLVFVPKFICRLQKETTLVIQKELPADPEHIFRNEDKEKVPDYFFPPIRIPFGNPGNLPEGEGYKGLVQADDKDPLNVRITAEIVIIIRVRIKKGRYITLLTSIGSLEEAMRQIQDTAVAMAFREFAKVTPAVVMKNLHLYNEMLEREIQTLVSGSKSEDESDNIDWGLSLQGAQVKLINFHRLLNTAIGNVSIASLNGKATVISADAKRQELELLGNGNANAEFAVLTKRTEGFAKMMTDLDTDPEIVIGAETARAITSSEGQKTIIAGSKGFADLIGIAASIGQAIKSPNEKEGEKL